MCRANLSLSFDREGVSYLNVLSNDANRVSNLNSKVRFITGYVYIFRKIQIGTIRISNAQRQLLFRPKKKKEKKKYCLNIFYKFLEFCFILLAKRFQKFEILLAENYSFIFFFFQSSTPCNALNFNLPLSVQQLTHDQMEFYTDGAILFMQ